MAPHVLSFAGAHFRSRTQVGKMSWHTTTACHIGSCCTTLQQRTACWQAASRREVTMLPLRISHH
jgi:hypothetical protein